MLGFFEILSELGTEDFYFLVMPILFWSVDAALGMRVGFLLAFSAMTNTFLKWVFGLPRPYWIDSRVKGLVAEPSFGAPSGHAQFNLSIYGLIAVNFEASLGMDRGNCAGGTDQFLASRAGCAFLSGHPVGLAVWLPCAVDILCGLKSR